MYRNKRLSSLQFDGKCRMYTINNYNANNKSGGGAEAFP